MCWLCPRGAGGAGLIRAAAAHHPRARSTFHIHPIGCSPSLAATRCDESAIHVVATAPLALLIELGRLVVPSVYKSVIVHQFDPQTARYVPVLDVIARRVV